MLWREPGEVHCSMQRVNNELAWGAALDTSHSIGSVGWLFAFVHVHFSKSNMMEYATCKMMGGYLIRLAIDHLALYIFPSCLFSKGKAFYLVSISFIYLTMSSSSNHGMLDHSWRYRVPINRRTGQVIVFCCSATIRCRPWVPIVVRSTTNDLVFVVQPSNGSS